MSRERDALGQCATYLDTSPIARFACWTVDRVRISSHQKISGEPSLHLVKEHEVQRSVAQKEQLDIISGELRKPCYDTDNKVHNWPLGRRVFIAAVISWYTQVF